MQYNSGLARTHKKKSMQALRISLFPQLSSWRTFSQTCQSWSWWSFLAQPQWPTHNWGSLCSSPATPGKGWHQTALSSDLRTELNGQRGGRTAERVGGKQQQSSICPDTFRFNKNSTFNNKQGLFGQRETPRLSCAGHRKRELLSLSLKRTFWLSSP